MKLPDMPRKGVPVESTVKSIIDYLRATKLRGKGIRESPNGTTISSVSNSRKAIIHPTPTLCPFGKLASMSTGGFTTGIRGGLVYVGDKNFNVPQRGINLASSGTWLIYLEIDCESNRDDDGEIFLPGIKTSAETDPSTFWQSASWSAGPPETQYPDNTNPEVSDGLGTIIIQLAS